MKPSNEHRQEERNAELAKSSMCVRVCAQMTKEAYAPRACYQIQMREGWSLLVDLEDKQLQFGAACTWKKLPTSKLDRHEITKGSPVPAAISGV